MNELKQFSINDIEMFRDDDSVDFAIAKIWFLASGNNSHRNPISEEVLRRDAKSALGKFVVAKYNKDIDDVLTHLADEAIVGYIPPESEIVFEAKDGKIFAVAQAVISKIYATEVYRLFESNNFRNVSCEFSAWEEQADAYGNRPIRAFEIHGITILGLDYKPSVAGAEMKMIQFSEQAADEFYRNKMFASDTNNVDKGDSLINKSESEDKTLETNGGENKMDEKEIIETQEEETKEFSEQPDEEVEVETKEFAEDESEDAEESNDESTDESVEEMSECEEMSDEETVEEMECHEEEMSEDDTDAEEAEDNSEDTEESEKQMSYDAYADIVAIDAMLENETEQARELVRELLASRNLEMIMSKFCEIFAERNQFSDELTNMRQAQRNLDVSAFFSELKYEIPEEKVKEFTEQVNAIPLTGDLTNWKNAVKVFAYENGTLKQTNENDEVLRFGEKAEVNKSVFDRYLNK